MKKINFIAIAIVLIFGNNYLFASELSVEQRLDLLEKEFSKNKQELKHIKRPLAKDSGFKYIGNFRGAWTTGSNGSLNHMLSVLLVGSDKRILAGLI
ncbi:carbohydrate porin [Vibrio sp. PP-XX7]